eukprot:CAMPEP_0114349524 /NCGR_PEP_ID=MMETSP0101-20121206/15592_1 /TAXON_ID=38822 ORGANISM="Pteridomonas danica, Strain PT" /NCGR_SAMPLE_ID=MMETSP0101 /ASSEMBLY_ACC=CAM_ASM_000211 /LENGTH=194 /DNA_ID=CAMNT_0001488131 /DNA_START=188 /DNA_END=769 /DNA_ORIENTATION=+
MRRSKALSEKMGLETEWNCAISLREVMDSDEPAWSVKAQMPHGPKAIRKHIDEVDNVPLLVSMFADSTPSTVNEMIHVFQEYDESTLVLGTSYRACNLELFSSSDVSIALSTLPQGMLLNQLPKFTSLNQTSTSTSTTSPMTSSHVQNKQQLCQEDFIFNEKIIALSSCLILPHTPPREESSLTHIKELIYEGR